MYKTIIIILKALWTVISFCIGSCCVLGIICLNDSSFGEHTSILWTIVASGIVICGISVILITSGFEFINKWMRRR